MPLTLPGPKPESPHGGQQPHNVRGRDSGLRMRRPAGRHHIHSVNLILCQQLQHLRPKPGGCSVLRLGTARDFSCP